MELTEEERRLLQQIATEANPQKMTEAIARLMELLDGDKSQRGQDQPA